MNSFFFCTGNVVQMLRGFPTDLIKRLRHRPPTALLDMLLRRFRSFEETSFQQYPENGQYIWDRLPDQVLKFGAAAVRNNFWLFPILVVSSCHPIIIRQSLFLPEFHIFSVGKSSDRRWRIESTRYRRVHRGFSGEKSGISFFWTNSADFIH